jgi:hypothetical protein
MIVRNGFRRDAGYATDDSVVSGLGLPVLAIVPEMLTGKERSMRRQQAIAWRLAMAAAVVCVAVALWVIVG